MKLLIRIIYFVVMFLPFSKIEAQLQIPQHLDCVKINHLYRMACHNCYEPGVAPFGIFKQMLDATRVVELDIHSHQVNFTEAPSGVWYVRHRQTFNTGNNDNNCGTLGDQDFNICLVDIEQWHSDPAHQGHDPIIVFLDLKRQNVTGGPFWDNVHTTTHFESVLNQFAMDLGGLDVIYKPSDLKGDFLTLREAARNENWPTLGNLKNKVMLVLTGENIILNDYLSNLGSNAIAFVAASPEGSNLEFPDNISSNNYQHIVFYNLKDDQTAAAANFIPNNGFMSRSWQDDNPSGSGYYGGSIAAKVNNIAIKNIQANNLNTFMNYQLIDINNITVGGSSSNPHRISSQYNSILQHALIKLTVHDLIIESGTTYNLRAGQEVDLQVGVDIQAGSNTDISIGNCVDYANNLRVNPSVNTNVLSQTVQDEMLYNSTRQNNVNEQLKIDRPPLLYPNPVKEVVYIDYSNSMGNTAIVTLYDLTGRVVATKNYTPSIEGKQSFSLNINELKEGTYFYTLQVGMQIHNGKVVKIEN